MFSASCLGGRDVALLASTLGQSRIYEAENERKTRELTQARDLQLSMLPGEMPRLPGLDVAAATQTAAEVGGDYYDVKPAGDGALLRLRRCDGTRPFRGHRRHRGEGALHFAHASRAAAQAARELRPRNGGDAPPDPAHVPLPDTDFTPQHHRRLRGDAAAPGVPRRDRRDEELGAGPAAGRPIGGALRGTDGQPLGRRHDPLRKPTASPS